MPQASWKQRLPKLLTGTLSRQQNGRWNITTANAWGVLALQRYQQQFEAVKPSGKSFAVLSKDGSKDGNKVDNNNGRVIDWKIFPKGATAFLPLGTETSALKLRHEGVGQPYVSVTTLAAVPITQAVQRGFNVQREIIAIDQKTPGKWRRGDVLRIRLNIDARDDMGWVVVEDPIPAGASILGSGTQRDSAILTQTESNRGNAWPAWQERLFDSYRAYYEYIPRGRFSLEYTLRLNSDGQFQLPPTRIEAMYAPEMFGEAPNGVFEVAP
jgi:alpha-2-macroglobulin